MSATHQTVSADDAEHIAIAALAFLAEDDGRMARFLELTGCDPAHIATAARDPAFLPGVLDHLLADEALLLTYCANVRLAPDRVAAARRALQRRDAAGEAAG